MIKQLHLRHLLRNGLSTVANTGFTIGMYIWFLGTVFEEKITCGLELIILAHRLFNGGHKITVDKVWLDQVRDNLGLIPENAAPEGGFNFLLCMG
jgi:hypothetical protein